MFRFLIGSFLSAVVLFAFGAAFWTCPIPYAYVEKPSTADGEFGATLREHLPNDGLYLVPGVHADPTVTLDAYRRGPVATIHYRRDGVEPMAPPVMMAGFFHGWITTALLAVMLRLAALPRYGQRLVLVTLAGLAAANYMKLGDGIYWYQPWPWLVLTAAYDAVAFLVAGCVLAAIVKPAPAKESVAPKL